MSEGIEARKIVTVVFCDVAAYTNTGEQIDPESRRRLNTVTYSLRRVFNRPNRPLIARIRQYC
jgi:hypothetical protein